MFFYNVLQFGRRACDAMWPWREREEVLNQLSKPPLECLVCLLLLLTSPYQRIISDDHLKFFLKKETYCKLAQTELTSLLKPGNSMW